MKTKLLKAIDKKIEERKGTTFINGTGSYGDPFKKQVIKKFNLDEEYSKKIMYLSFGEVKKIAESLSD